MGRPRAKVKRGFGEVGQLPSGRYRARYTGPDGGRHSAPITFVARIDAEGWLVDQERMISRGEWEPPARQVREVHEAPLLLGEYAATVVARRRIRPSTAALYAKLLRLTILPAFAKRPLGEITAAEISTWYAGMRTTPTHAVDRRPLADWPRRPTRPGPVDLARFGRLRRGRLATGRLQLKELPCPSICSDCSARPSPTW